jgi:hypothetical protein
MEKLELAAKFVYQKKIQTHAKFVPCTFSQSVHSETYRGRQAGRQLAIDAMDPPSTPLSSSCQWKTQIQKAKQKNTRSSSISKQNKKKYRQTKMLLPPLCGS